MSILHLGITIAMHNNKVGQLEDDIMTKARRLVFALCVYIYSGSNIILLMDILHILGEYLNIFSGFIEIMRIQRNLSEYVYYILSNRNITQGF